MSVVRRARDGRIVIVPKPSRVNAMRRRAIPTDKHPAGKKPPQKDVTPPLAPVPTPEDMPVIEDDQYPGEPADISEDDSWPMGDTGYGDTPKPEDITEPEAEPFPIQDLPELPRGNASKEAWVDFAMAANIAVDLNATRNDIRDYVLDRMSQPAPEGGRLARPEDEPVTHEGDHGTTDRD